MAKKKQIKDDLERLKEAVGLETSEVEADFPAVPASMEEVSKNRQNIPKKSIERREIPVSANQQDTELFVKIDEHTKVAAELIEVKQDIKAIAETIALLAKSEKLKEEAIAKMSENLNKLNEKLNNVERRLMTPEGLEAVPSEGPVDKLTNLHSDLESLKSELSRLK